MGTEGDDHGKEFEFRIEHVRREFPLVMSKSRRRQNGVHGFSSINSVGISTDIHEQNFVRSEDDKKSRQMLKRSEHAQVHTQYVDNPLTRFAYKDRFRDHGICLGSGSGDEGDDDACSSPRSVFHISFDCLDSQMVGTEYKMHIESHVGSKAE